VLPWGSEDERHRCSRIAAAVSGALVPPRMRVSELARVAQGAQWVVGVDTGLAHLAAAVGVPVVGLYCGSDPALTGLHGDGRVRNLGGPAQMPAVAEVIVALESLR
jgi:heptosyltransferase-1